MYTKDQLNDLYERIVKTIDISNEMFDTAEKEYEDLGNYYLEQYGLSNGTKKVYIQKGFSKDDTGAYFEDIYVTVNIDDTVYFTLDVDVADYVGELPDDEFLFGFNVEVIDNAQIA